MPAVLFRCDGGPEIGIGHVMRCHALAKAFGDLGWRCSFAMSQASASLFLQENANVVPDGNDGTSSVSAAIAAQNIDCLVVDHYGLDAQFEREAAKVAALIVVIDDLANRPHHCHLLVDSNPQRQASDYAQYTTANTRFLLGARYALLRSEFGHLHRARGQRLKRTPKRLIIALGGADPGNVSAHLLEALPHLSGAGLQAILIVGQANPNRAGLIARAEALGAEVVCDPPNLVALMADADIAISGGGTTCLEFACLGVPTLAIILADNQRAIARAIENAGAARLLDGDDSLNPRRVADAVMAMVSDWKLRQHMGAAGQTLIDGKGAERVAEETAQLLAARKLEKCL
jgi:UDP-2,4-diacetamido-2,4,6-trideoxy-beta-L-altropyranose hydrolase